MTYFYISKSELKIVGHLNIYIGVIKMYNTLKIVILYNVLIPILKIYDIYYRYSDKFCKLLNIARLIIIIF